MEKISEDDFKKAVELMPERKKEVMITDEEFEEMIKKMQNPINAQKELAVKIKVFLDKRIENEMEENGCLGENTRRWIETYNNILQRLQSAIHGDKSVSLHVHKVTHGDINAKIREAGKIKVLK